MLGYSQLGQADLCLNKISKYGGVGLNSMVTKDKYRNRKIDFPIGACFGEQDY